MEIPEAILRAAAAIQSAEALVITAGAGMGVDSGLPDFRGAEGFWKAYPAAARRGLRFEQLANPAWFGRDPAMAWGFYGHRRNLYRATQPHEGFTILRKWAEAKPGGCFVFTSNVDGHFQRAGFSDQNIVECHGSLNHQQCVEPCCESIWDAEREDITVDVASLHASAPLPTCPHCKKLARPNVLMFGDGQWIPDRTFEQEQRWRAWLRTARHPVVIECGAGTAIPTVRMTSERIAEEYGGKLIRINVREPGVPPRHIPLAMGALSALRQIRDCLCA